MLIVLDTTLRDGGHRTDFHFTPVDLQEILVPLDRSAVDYIEIGYRNGSIHPITNVGVAGRCEKDYLLYCRTLISRAKISVMVYPNRVTIADLVELKDCGVALLRICVVKGGLLEAEPLIEFGKKLGLEVSVNFIHASHYQDHELETVLKGVSAFCPDMIYFADSNGSLMPNRVSSIYEFSKQHCSIPLGFHAHDNLGLAQANTIAAISAGAQCVDVTLSGMGKGIGNLRTEYFVAYLHAIKNTKYSLEDVLSAANYVRRTFATEQNDIDLEEFKRSLS